MKRFVYKIESEKYSNKSGSYFRTIATYRILKNDLVYCGSFGFSTGSYKGDISEVMNHLAKNNQLSKKYENGYYERTNGKFEIKEI